MAGTIKNIPAEYSWEVYAGDRNRQEFAFFATSDVPWDLTGATFKAQARLDSVDAVIAIEAKITIEDAVGGIVSIEWDGEEVRTLLNGAESWEGVWDVEILEAAQTLPVTLAVGPWKATMDVTKP